MIVGGRTVGVEFMGEVINLYPSKNIIIVHSGDTLLDYWPDVASQQVKKYTFNKRVTIVSFYYSSIHQKELIILIKSIYLEGKW